MTEEEKIAVDESAENSSKNDNSPAPTAEVKEESIKTNEDIDPRIVEIIGKDKINEAYGEKPESKEDEKTNDDKGENPESKKEENQENMGDDQEVVLPNIEPLKSNPTRLDKRIAKLFIQNLHLAGEEEIPTEEELMAELSNYSVKDKIAAMHHYRLQAKKLRGEKITGREVLDEEDVEAIKDAERENIRQEILNEEHQKTVMTEFVSFLGSHPELDENTKEFNPSFAKAVEVLFEGGMPINEAYDTITEQVAEIKEEQKANLENKKSEALSGVLTGSGDVPSKSGELTWDDAVRIEKENPALYLRMTAEGKFNHLM